jgi:hypothetical protein
MTNEELEAIRRILDGRTWDEVPESYVKAKGAA